MATIRLRRGTAAQWIAANPVLASGEPGYETDTGLLCMGDGVTPYLDLPKFLDEERLSATFVPGAFVEDTSGSANSLRIGAGALPDADGGLNNLAIGVDAGKDIDATGPHLFIGNQAGQHVKGTDSGVSSHNIGIGLQSMRGGGTLGSDGTKVTGGFNLGVGIQTLWVLKTGSRNVALGFSALRYNLDGNDNTAVGTNALFNSTAPAATAVGAQALASSTTALAQTAVGYQALNAVTTGGFNTATGFLAGALLAGAAQRNTLVGAQTLPNQTGGEDNVAVGYNAGAGPSAGNGNTWIGKNARPDSSAEVALVTALGCESRASNLYATALGAFASAAHARSVALGAQSATTSADQIMIGARDIETTGTGLGFISKSPDGTRYRLTAPNGGGAATWVLA